MGTATSPVLGVYYNSYTMKIKESNIRPTISQFLSLKIRWINTFCVFRTCRSTVHTSLHLSCSYSSVCSVTIRTTRQVAVVFFSLNIYFSFSPGEFPPDRVPLGAGVPAKDGPPPAAEGADLLVPAAPMAARVPVHAPGGSRRAQGKVRTPTGPPQGQSLQFRGLQP